MIESRKKLMYDSKILSSRKNFTVIHPHVKKYIDKFDMSVLSPYKGDNFIEKVWRYLHDDNSEKVCKKCDNSVNFSNSLTKGFLTYCSQDCARPILYGIDNGFYNKKHSKCTREKMSKNHADFSGDKNPYRKALLANPEKKIKASKRAKKIWESRTDQEKAEISNKLSLSQKNQRSKSVPKGYQTKHVTSNKLNKTAFLRSSWEIKLFEKLDFMAEVSSIEIESLYIPYLDELKTRHAISDFLITIDDKQILIEVKPQPICELKQQILKAQYDYCIENDIKFIIVDIDIIENNLTKIIKMALNDDFKNIKMFDIKHFKSILNQEI